jgi:Mg-chelatase subunit ChlD
MTTTTPAPSPADSQAQPAAGQEGPESNTAGLAPEDKQASISQPATVRPLEDWRARQCSSARSAAQPHAEVGPALCHRPTPQGTPMCARCRYGRGATTCGSARRAGAGWRSVLRTCAKGARPVGYLVLFAVDASSSMGARDRMVATKAPSCLLLDAYQRSGWHGELSWPRRDSSAAAYRQR